MEEDVALIHLRRITGWNAPNYNPQEDEYFIEDALWSISRKIRHYELTKQEIKHLSVSLKNATNRKNAYKIIDKIIKTFKTKKQT